ncbi:hypothetical protein [Bathymodiolus thermophilus thioautotrophic gill symbiont]|uniref:Uncharacterized protein n=1 Tax=Bathymodiolus thermophilus thioautotrophic gill symbiont TaxID=2360 RepID=A0A8H8XCN7_9GAMM|nr:hypothetical protein [Bathymodiolus thermophilus thioautotrophic gill symbiont]CAB5496149.1 hypothetical protein THERMOS_438 [Bathymodiolus thermophilus thioautotrophic gill symbiont]
MNNHQESTSPPLGIFLTLLGQSLRKWLGWQPLNFVNHFYTNSLIIFNRQTGCFYLYKDPYSLYNNTKL